MRICQITNHFINRPFHTLPLRKHGHPMKYTFFISHRKSIHFITRINIQCSLKYNYLVPYNKIRVQIQMEGKKIHKDCQRHQEGQRIFEDLLERKYRALYACDSLLQHQVSTLCPRLYLDSKSGSGVKNPKNRTISQKKTNRQLTPQTLSSTNPCPPHPPPHQTRVIARPREHPPTRTQTRVIKKNQ